MEPIRIFLSYAREDFAAVRKLYNRLKAEGYQPWMDKVDLFKGDNFAKAIPKVIRETDFFIVCLSTRSVAKRSFVQREINLALDLFEERLESDLFIFPVRLDDCVAPERIDHFNWTDLFSDEADDEWEALLRSLREGVKRLGKVAPNTQTLPSPVPVVQIPVSLLPETKHPDPPVQNTTVNPSAERQQEVDRAEKPNAGDEYVTLLREERKAERPKTQAQSKPSMPLHPGIKASAITGGVIALLILGAVAVKQYSGSGQQETGASPKPTATVSTTPGNQISTFTEDLGNGVKLEMVNLPGGSFQMGSPKTEEGRNNDEEPQHRVTVSSFAIGKYEVTQVQWQAVMGDNPSYHKWDTSPVERVSWDEAQEFCRKLSSKTGKTYRLPTEAEWEYACRAGTIGAYAGTLDEMAWYSKNSEIKTHPVGQKQPNVWGLYDMHGNVWEWCQDWYGSDYYGQSPSTDPQGPRSGSDRVVRGGDWLHPAVYCRSAYRFYYSPGDSHDSRLGFRLLRTAR